MRFEQLVGAMILGLLTVACTPKKESTLLYPAAVVAAHQEPYYRTALWCVYTKGLDSAVFRKKGKLTLSRLCSASC
jgi:hypothetical protein